MNSIVYKYVAGGGKTTDSIKYMKNNKNGLYLAYTKSVVNSIKCNGLLAKTIDSFFSSYIIPKFLNLLPIVEGKKIEYTNVDSNLFYLKNISNIHIDSDGNIYNGKSKVKSTTFKLTMTREELKSKKNEPNYKTISYIFGKNKIILTDILRDDLASYLIKKYPEKIIELLSERFSYIIFDEAQDLNGYKEAFAKLVYNSNIKSIYSGDTNQNIMQGGKWFETLKADKIKSESYRCSELVCKVIREKTNIEIFGNSSNYNYIDISDEDIPLLDDGNRVLLYYNKTGKKEIINNWKGITSTIQSAKGSTIPYDVVLIGKVLNKKAFYVGATRSTKNVYNSIKVIKN